MFLMGEAEFCHIWIYIEQSGHLVHHHPSQRQNPVKMSHVSDRVMRAVLLFKKQAFDIQVPSLTGELSLGLQRARPRWQQETC